jgi:hypothetical protein
MDNNDNGNAPDHDHRWKQIRHLAYEALCGRDDFQSVRDGFRDGKGLPRSLHTRLEEIIATCRVVRG